MNIHDNCYRTRCSTKTSNTKGGCCDTKLDKNKKQSRNVRTSTTAPRKRRGALMKQEGYPSVNCECSELVNPYQRVACHENSRATSFRYTYKLQKLDKKIKFDKRHTHHVNSTTSHCWRQTIAYR